MEARPEYVDIAYLLFARLAPICDARSVLINKISASELRRKFIKSALLVGEEEAAVSCKGISTPNLSRGSQPSYMGGHPKVNVVVEWVGRRSPKERLVTPDLLITLWVVRRGR